MRIGTLAELIQLFRYVPVVIVEEDMRRVCQFY